MTSQTPPSEPLANASRSRFGYRFVSLARRWRRYIDGRLADAGLTDATWVPLTHLYESGDGISQKELALRAGLDTSTLVRLIDILTKKGLLERRADPQDRRARLVFLTEQGRQQTIEIRKALHNAENEVLGELSDVELDQMMAWFDRIERRLVEHRSSGEPE